MSTVLCLQCQSWFDPARPHACGVIGDDTVKRLEERIDAHERRIRELEAALARRSTARPDDAAYM